MYKRDRTINNTDNVAQYVLKFHFLHDLLSGSLLYFFFPHSLKPVTKATRHSPRSGVGFAGFVHEKSLSTQSPNCCSVGSERVKLISTILRHARLSLPPSSVERYQAHGYRVERVLRGFTAFHGLPFCPAKRVDALRPPRIWPHRTHVLCILSRRRLVGNGFRENEQTSIYG